MERMGTRGGRTTTGRGHRRRPDTVKRKLEALVAETEADEVMIVSDFFDIRDRLRSFEIVASLKTAPDYPPAPEPERPGPRPTGRLTIAMPAFPALY